MQYYNRVTISRVAKSTDELSRATEQLHKAITRVSEHWNDAVSKGIQTGQVNSIISSCNSFNSLVTSMGAEIESDMQRMEELHKQFYAIDI
jgi:bisphosphoglycerate-dependent phosphoglycerate mutase